MSYITIDAENIEYHIESCRQLLHRNSAIFTDAHQYQSRHRNAMQQALSNLVYLDRKMIADDGGLCCIDGNPKVDICHIPCHY